MKNDDIVYLECRYEDAKRIEELVDKTNANRQRSRKRAIEETNQRAIKTGKKPRHKLSYIPDIKIISMIRKI
jgi:hypothetical protein